MVIQLEQIVSHFVISNFQFWQKKVQHYTKNSTLYLRTDNEVSLVADTEAGLSWSIFGRQGCHSGCHLTAAFIAFSISQNPALPSEHGLQRPSEENVFTARPKIYSYCQIFRYGRSIFYVPHLAQIFKVLWFMPSLGVNSLCFLDISRTHHLGFTIVTFWTFLNIVCMGHSVF